MVVKLFLFFLQLAGIYFPGFPFSSLHKFTKAKKKKIFPWFSSLPLDASLWLVLVAAGLTAVVPLSLLIWIYSSLGLFGSVFH